MYLYHADSQSDGFGFVSTFKKSPWSKFFCIDRDPKKNTDTSDPDIRLTYCCTLLEKLGGFPVPMYMTDYAKVNLCMQTFSQREEKWRNICSISFRHIQRKIAKVFLPVHTQHKTRQKPRHGDKTIPRLVLLFLADPS